jgi:hypothetical protein
VSGTSIVMAAASSTATTQDWTVESENTVGAAVSAGLLPARLGFLYGDSSLYEFQYAPGGIPSGNCLADNYGTYVGNSEDEYYPAATSVTLSECGLTTATLWAVDQYTYAEGTGSVDLINMGYQSSYSYEETWGTAASTAGLYANPYAEPFVLTVNSSTGKVALAELSELGGNVSTSQLWSNYLSPAQAAAKKAAASESS